MKAMKLTGIGRMEMMDAPKPEIRNSSDVLVKLAVVGVCGSDVHYFEDGRIGSAVIPFPFTVGHECSGIVEEVGTGVRHVKAGDEVAIDPAVFCGKCDQCSIGRENTCRKMSFLGTPPKEGCLCEYIVMPQESVFPIHGKMTLAQAALCEPFSIGVYTAQQARIPKNADILILGSGPIGLSVMLAARAQGVQNIYVTEKIKERLDVARKNGAVWAGSPDQCDIVKEVNSRVPQGIDVAFECAGQQETIDQSLDVLKPGGAIVLVGIPRFERVSFQIDRLRRKELTIINIRRQNKCVQPALDLVADKKANLDFMLTHRFKFERSQEAMELVAGYRDGVIKAIIEF
jgi:L-iditol 2-dehydrogenase